MVRASWNALCRNVVAQVRSSLQMRRQRKRSLTLERLEDRTLLTAYVVNTLLDNSAADGFISLREAIDAARTNAAVGDAPAGSAGSTDTITFANGLAGTILLGGTQLTIGGDTTITGPGANVITVSGNNASRVFFIESGIVEISGLQITGGTADFGGGFEVDGNDATLTLRNSWVQGNTATAAGGGVDVFNGVLNILNSTISGNTATGEASFHGGGGVNMEGGTLRIINSTVSGNTAQGAGGGVRATVSGSLTLTNSTVTGNRADSDNDSSDSGGGIRTSVTTTLNNTIVAGNFVDNATAANDINGTVSGSHNLIGDAGSAGGLTDATSGNKVGVNGAGVRDINTVINTTLSGDPTPVHFVIPDGPANDAGNNALSVDHTAARLQFSQRGAPYVRVMNGTVDIGADEFFNLGVNTLDDETSNADTVSLREAIAMANARIGFDNVFSLPNGVINLTQGELLITDDLLISGPGAGNLTINGQSNSRVFHIIGNTVELVGMTITGGNALLSPSPVGEGNTGLGGGILNEKGTLTVRESVVTFNSGTYGGGINNYGTGGTATLHLIDSTVSNNSVTENAGGLYNWGFGGTAVMNVTRSTVAGNQATHGGGFFNWTSGATLNVLNSTISGNRANGDGGGVDSEPGSVLTSVNSTWVLNRADADGTGGGTGGAFYAAASVTVHNTIVAGNLRGTGTTADDISAGTLQAASSNNLIGDAATAGGLTNGTNGNIVGVGGAGVRPLNTIVNPTLANNTGIFATLVHTQTHALAHGSVAVGAGSNARANDAGLTTDQRSGVFNRLVGTVDIGAFEEQDLAGGTTGTALDWNADLGSAESFNEGFQFVGDVDFYRISLAPGKYVIRTTAPQGLNTDTVVRVFANDQTTIVAEDDQSGPGNLSRLILNVPTAATFFIRVTEFLNDQTGAYTIHISPQRSDVVGYDPATGQWRTGTSNGNVFTNTLGPLWNNGVGFDTFTGDFNGDGLIDLAGRTDAGEWFVSVNNGGDTYGAPTSWGSWTADATAGWTNVTVADFTGDGLADIVGFDNQRRFFVAVSNGVNVFTTTQWGSLGTGFIAHTVGDFNGDGRADIASLSGNGVTTSPWTVSESTGSAFTLDGYGSVAAHAVRNWRNLRTGDFNGDNRDDILIQDQLGNWFIGYSNTISGTDDRFTVQYANRWNPTLFVEFLIGDFNGDGRDDMAGRQNNNVWQVNRSLLNGRMTVSFWANSGTAITSVVGDFNGDGISDIATLRTTGKIWFVLLGQASNTFLADGYGTWTGFGTGRLYAGEVV